MLHAKQLYTGLTGSKLCHPLVSPLVSGWASCRQPVSRGVWAGATAQRLHAASVCPIRGSGGAEHAQSAPRGGGRGQFAKNAGHPSTAEPWTLRMQPEDIRYVYKHQHQHQENVPIKGALITTALTTTLLPPFQCTFCDIMPTFPQNVVELLPESCWKHSVKVTS